MRAYRLRDKLRERVTTESPDANGRSTAHFGSLYKNLAAIDNSPRGADLEENEPSPASTWTDDSEDEGEDEDEDEKEEEAEEDEAKREPDTRQRQRPLDPWRHVPIRTIHLVGAAITPENIAQQVFDCLPPAMWPAFVAAVNRLNRGRPARN
jgi:hypothetical protein